MTNKQRRDGQTFVKLRYDSVLAVVPSFRDNTSEMSCSVNSSLHTIQPGVLLIFQIIFSRKLSIFAHEALSRQMDDP